MRDCNQCENRACKVMEAMYDLKTRSIKMRDKHNIPVSSMNEACANHKPIRRPGFMVIELALGNPQGLHDALFAAVPGYRLPSKIRGLTI